jgi:ABC-type microcin C transport system permease subunit YejB
MLAYIIRRALYVIPVVFGVALITFILFNVVGWNSAAMMLGKHASAEEIAALQEKLGLSGPLHKQFLHYLQQIITFDFGRSFATNQKISTMILDGVVPSLTLTIPIFVIDLVIAIGIALVAAFGWGYVVTVRAEREARKEAKACAREMIDRWLVEEAPLIVRRKLEMLQDTSMGTEDDDHAADEMGRAAG